MLFASPDFGAGATVMGVICGIGFVVLVVGIIAVVRGLILITRQPPDYRWRGLVFILAGVLLPISCCSAPSIMFRVNHDTPPLGSYPNGVIQEGMTPDDVRGLLGNPHQVYEQDPQRVTWLYWIDRYEIGWFMVTF